MTSHVKVSAHCASDIQVRVSVYHAGEQEPFIEKYLSDGETFEQSVHGDIYVVTREEVVAKEDCSGVQAAISDGGGQYPEVPPKKP